MADDDDDEDYSPAAVAAPDDDWEPYRPPAAQPSYQPPAAQRAAPPDDWEPYRPSGSQQAQAPPEDDWEPYRPEPEAEGMLATGLRHFVHGLPAMATGAGLGGLYGSLGGPFGTLGGIVVGGIGALGESYLQSKATEKYWPEEAERLRAGAEANPVSAILGNVATAGPFIRPNLGTLALGQRAFSGAITGGMDVGQQLAFNGDVDVKEAALQAAGGAVFAGRPTRLGRAIGIPDHPPAPGEQPPPKPPPEPPPEPVWPAQGEMPWSAQRQPELPLSPSPPWGPSGTRERMTRTPSELAPDLNLQERMQFGGTEPAGQTRTLAERGAPAPELTDIAGQYGYAPRPTETFGVEGQYGLDLDYPGFHGKAGPDAAGGVATPQPRPPGPDGRTPQNYGKATGAKWAAGVNVGGDPTLAAALRADAQSRAPATDVEARMRAQGVTPRQPGEPLRTATPEQMQAAQQRAYPADQPRPNFGARMEQEFPRAPVQPAPATKPPSAADRARAEIARRGEAADRGMAQFEQAIRNPPAPAAPPPPSPAAAGRPRTPLPVTPQPRQPAAAAPAEVVRGPAAPAVPPKTAAAIKTSKAAQQAAKAKAELEGITRTQQAAREGPRQYPKEPTAAMPAHAQETMRIANEIEATGHPQAAAFANAMRAAAHNNMVKPDSLPFYRQKLNEFGAQVGKVDAEKPRETFALHDFLEPKQRKAFDAAKARTDDVGRLLRDAEARVTGLVKQINDAGFKKDQLQGAPDGIKTLGRQLSEIGGVVSRLTSQLAPRKGRDAAATLKNNMASLREVLGAKEPAAAAPAPLEQRIRNVVRDLVGEPPRDSVRLNDLRAKLPDVPRDQLDAALVAMQRNKTANLMPLDNPRDIKRVGDAALRDGRNTYHTLVLEPAAAPAVKPPDTALATANKASAEFRQAQADYRARKIGDEEFLAARAKYDAASKEYDIARGEAPPPRAAPEPLKTPKRGVPGKEGPEGFHSVEVRHQRSGKWALWINGRTEGFDYPTRADAEAAAKILAKQYDTAVAAAPEPQKAAPAVPSDKRRFTDYKEARAQAQKLANSIGHDVGIWRAEEYGKDGFNVRSLPKPENRYGHELQAEVVSPTKPPIVPPKPAAAPEPPKATKSPLALSHEIEQRMREERAAAPKRDPKDYFKLDADISHTDYVRRLGELQDNKPRPIKKLWNDPSKAPPEQVAAAERAIKDWNNEYNRVSKIAKLALARDNEAFRARQAEPPKAAAAAPKEQFGAAWAKNIAAKKAAASPYDRMPESQLLHMGGNAAREGTSPPEGLTGRPAEIYQTGWRRVKELMASEGAEGPAAAPPKTAVLAARQRGPFKIVEVQGTGKFMLTRGAETVSQHDNLGQAHIAMNAAANAAGIPETSALRRVPVPGAPSRTASGIAKTVPTKPLPIGRRQEPIQQKILETGAAKAEGPKLPPREPYMEAMARQPETPEAPAAQNVLAKYYRQLPTKTLLDMQQRKLPDANRAALEAEIARRPVKPETSGPAEEPAPSPQPAAPAEPPKPPPPKEPPPAGKPPKEPPVPPVEATKEDMRKGRWVELQRLLGVTASSTPSGRAGRDIALRAKGIAEQQEQVAKHLFTNKMHKDINTLPGEMIKRKGDTEAKNYGLRPLINYIQGGDHFPGYKPPDRILPVIDALREVYANYRKNITAIPEFEQQQFWNDKTYLTGHFKNPDEAAGFFSSWAGGPTTAGGRGSLKAKKFPTDEDAIDAGHTPVTSNPIERVLMYVNSMAKFLAWRQTLGEGKATGYIKAFAPEAIGGAGTPEPGYRNRPPPGWARIDNAFDAGGRALWAPKEFAVAINNLHSAGITHPVYQGIRRVGNAFTAMELLGPLYHGVTTVHETIARGMGTAVSQVAAGRPDLAAKSFARGLGRPYTGVSQANRLHEVYLRLHDPAALDAINATPQERAIVGAMRDSNWKPFGIQHTLDYDMSRAGSAWTAARRGEFSIAKIKENFSRIYKDREITEGMLYPFRLAGQTMQAISQPLFEFYIPRMKAAAAYDNIREWLQLNPDATPAQLHETTMRTLKDVDNFMGEMTHENTMMNKVVRDGMAVVLRSPSFTIGGTFRGIIGGWQSGIRGALKGQNRASMKSEYYDPRFASAIAYFLSTGMLGATYTFLKTGKVDTDDIWPAFLGTPHTGGQQPGVGGKKMVPEEALLPGYHKDLRAYLRPFTTDAGELNQIWEELKNKAPVLLTTLMEQNENKRMTAYGPEPIVPPNAKLPENLSARGKALLEKLIPIVAKQAGQTSKKGTHITYPEQVFGVRPPGTWQADPEGSARSAYARHVREWQAAEKAANRDRISRGLPPLPPRPMPKQLPVKPQTGYAAGGMVG